MSARPGVVSWAQPVTSLVGCIQPWSCLQSNEHKLNPNRPSTDKMFWRVHDLLSSAHPENSYNINSDPTRQIGAFLPDSGCKFYTKIPILLWNVASSIQSYRHKRRGQISSTWCHRDACSIIKRELSSARTLEASHIEGRDSRDSMIITTWSAMNPALKSLYKSSLASLWGSKHRSWTVLLSICLCCTRQFQILTPAWAIRISGVKREVGPNS